MSALKGKSILHHDVLEIQLQISHRVHLDKAVEARHAETYPRRDESFNRQVFFPLFTR